jgi:hypothetical protein
MYVNEGYGSARALSDITMALKKYSSKIRMQRLDHFGIGIGKLPRIESVW